MVKKKNTTLTSINLDSHLYKTFKVQSIQDDITLTNFVSTAMHLFYSSSDFKQEVLLKIKGHPITASLGG